MSFTSVEQSKQGGRPYEKYEFQYGATSDESYRYTNAIQDMGDFISLPIKRESYRTSGKVERDQLNITLPATTDLAQLILPYPPPYPISVKIWAGHHGDGDEMIVWVGRVLSNAFNGPLVVLTCESTLISLKRMGNRRRWQIACPLLLYGKGNDQCKAEREDFTVTTTVVAIEDGVPIFPADWHEPFNRDQFKMGTMRWTSPHGVEYRTIRRADADRIVFNGMLRGIDIGTEVELSLGCNHRMTDCQDVFDNIKNYGGDPWIPLQNPVKHANFW